MEDVGTVIKDVGRELGKRGELNDIRRCTELTLPGVTTPMLFSNQALDLNPTRTRALIQSYVESIRYVLPRHPILPSCPHRWACTVIVGELQLTSITADPAHAKPIRGSRTSNSLESTSSHGYSAGR